MERLKQIWANYKQISPAFRKSSVASSSCGDLANSNAAQLEQEIDYLQENLEYLSKHINPNNTNATSNDTNQYASTNPIAEVNDHFSNTATAASSYNPVGADQQQQGVGSYGVTSDTAAVYASSSPNQSMARDDVNNYEAINAGSRPGSTTARYPPVPAPANGRTPVDDGAANGSGGGGRYAGSAGAGKSSRPESRTSDRQQYPAGTKQPPELSRNNSVIDYGKYETGERRSESRLSRSSVTNDDGGGGGGGGGGTGSSAGTVRPGGVPKEPEYGRGAVEQERLSRASDSTKPDSTGGGGSGRLSRESVADQQRTSRQSMQSLVGSQGAAGYGQDPLQYATSDTTDPAAAAAAYGQSQQPYGDFAYQQAGGEQYQPLDDQSASAIRKATELWGTHVPAHRPGPERTDSDTSNRPARDGKTPCCHPSSSRPRQHLPQTTCDFRPIDSYPHMSISSPSLFGSSPDVSLTPSPTSTVLKNYDAASPNPR
ncbi:hypothetical protein ZHAS_00019955 [Anopheles sinensis]|uniref:Uncharacterized protein n=1 Tax=Anopheles sinensis TaxID=74873 RepID=A0A084WNK6_ANOSI|nr:hypothetical protein ZHAS_00019955 [Anopheles sinensis]